MRTSGNYDGEINTLDRRHLPTDKGREKKTAHMSGTGNDWESSHFIIFRLNIKQPLAQHTSFLGTHHCPPIASSQMVSENHYLGVRAAACAVSCHC
jgi:hypothetical protein